MQFRIPHFTLYFVLHVFVLNATSNKKIKKSATSSTVSFEHLPNDFFVHQLPRTTGLFGAIKILHRLRSSSKNVKQKCDTAIKLIVRVRYNSDNSQKFNTIDLFAFAAYYGFPYIIEIIDTLNIAELDYDASLDTAQDQNLGHTICALLKTNKVSSYSQIKCFKRAIQLNHAKSVEALIESKKLEKFACHRPLVLAIVRGHTDTVKVLIKSKLITENNFMYPNCDCTNILMVAAKCGYHEIVKILLGSPKITCTAIHAKCRKGKTALMHAAENGHTAIVKTFLKDHRVSINENNGKPDKYTALDFAIKKNHIETVTAFLECEEVNINACLLSAMCNTRIVSMVTMVSLLLDSNRVTSNIINWKSRFGLTPLMYAVIRKRTKCIKAFLASPKVTIEMVNFTNNKGKSALQIAQENEFTKIVNLLQNYINRNSN